MSSENKMKVTKKQVEEEFVSIDEKKRCLQSAIFDINQNDTFMGSVMQCLNINYTHALPTAGIGFDPEGRKWVMYINPFYFCKKILEHKGRKALLMHELSHVTHKHPMRAPFIKLHPKRRTLMNIAMDMSINQNIPNLPKGCKQCPPKDERDAGEACKNNLCPGHGIFVEDYFDTDDNGKKTPWPMDKPMEFYYHKLIARYMDSDDPDDGEGEGGEGGKSMDGVPKEFDTHDWESDAEEGDMLDATEELVKRAMQKRGLTMSTIPTYARELLEEIEARRSELDVKKLIATAIKKNASGFNREKTWTRRSRRFGLKAAGNRNGKLPHLAMYQDTSGSISIQEANDHLAIVDDFLRAGSRKCELNLWHTKVYYSEKYKLGDRIARSDYQSGGTDLTPTMQHIADSQPDLAIIYTDGCYGDVDYQSMVKFGTKFPQTLFIISVDGMVDHPLKRLGETIKIPNTGHMLSDKELEK